MKLIALVVVTLLAAGNASAQTRISSFDGNAITDSIQCDLGLFARKAAALGVAPGTTARITYSSSDIISQSTSVDIGAITNALDIGAGFGFGQSGTQIVSGTQSVSLSLTDPTYRSACSKGRPQVAVLDCLSHKSKTLGLKGQLRCDVGSKAVGRYNANGGVIIWYVNLGGSAEYDVTRSYSIIVESPIPAGPPPTITFPTPPEPVKSKSPYKFS